MSEATTPKLSVVIPVRNRSGTRLENCLRSLRWQDLDAATVEVLVCDFGSDATHVASIAELAVAHDARVVRVETEEIWNRSKALNHGIQATRGEFVMCTDADMIFKPDFLSTVLAAHAEAEEGAPRIIYCRCLDLPEEVAEQAWERGDYPALHAKASFRPKGGTGACQCASRAYFDEVRGYDEGYTYWGKEDDDFRVRAETHGLYEVYIEDRSNMLHQWHRKMKGDKRLRWWLNRLRYKLTKRTVVKNRRGWGGIRG
jgi:glycosyltransferase involved in cell wall biosynthesis